MIDEEIEKEIEDDEYIRCPKCGLRVEIDELELHCRKKHGDGKYRGEKRI